MRGDARVPSRIAGSSSDFLLSVRGELADEIGYVSAREENLRGVLPLVNVFRMLSRAVR